MSIRSGREAAGPHSSAPLTNRLMDWRRVQEWLMHQRFAELLPWKCQEPCVEPSGHTALQYKCVLLWHETLLVQQLHGTFYYYFNKLNLTTLHTHGSKVTNADIKNKKWNKNKTFYTNIQNPTEVRYMVRFMAHESATLKISVII